MTQRHSFLPVLAAALAVLAAAGAQAQTPLAITFAPDALSANAGDLVFYSATFANSSAADYFVDGAAFNSTDPNASLLQGFFNGDPVNGDPNTGAFEVFGGTSQTITGVFAMQLDPLQPNGTYHGIVTFTGQAASAYPNGNDGELGDAALTLNVPVPAAAVPEASSGAGLFLLLSLGTMGLAWHRRKACRI